MGCPSGQACHAYCFLPIFAHGSLLCPVSRFTHSSCITLQGFAALNFLSLHSGSILFSHLQSTGCPYWLACWSPLASGLSCLLQKKGKSLASPLLQAVAIPFLHYSGNLGMAPVAPLADGSRLTKTKRSQSIALDLFFLSIHLAPFISKLIVLFD
jgi:hypothetical protein